ncbi:protein of unknown function [Microbacterium sp. Nx66]|nr:protein of unknown function [Microbacterium sp. Nx66]
MTGPDTCASCSAPAPGRPGAERYSPFGQGDTVRLPGALNAGKFILVNEGRPSA